MNRNTAMILVVALIVVSLSTNVFAASQSTFSITPPPIASPVFDAKETHVKVGGVYLNMKSTDPGMDFKLSGYGLDMVTRKSFGNVLAIDWSVGVMYLKGDIKSALTGTSNAKMDISGANIPLSLNLEVQPLKTDIFNFILFAGPAVNISAMSIKSNTVIAGRTYSDTITSSSFLYGPQGGLQMGIRLGDFHIDLFGMGTNLRGTQDTSSSYGGSTSTSIPAYTTTSMGGDLVYDPWGLTLSSILQEAKQGDNNGFKTTIYQLSWSHKF